MSSQGACDDNTPGHGLVYEEDLRKMSLSCSAITTGGWILYQVPTLQPVVHIHRLIMAESRASDIFPQHNFSRSLCYPENVTYKKTITDETEMGAAALINQTIG